MEPSFSEPKQISNTVFLRLARRAENVDQDSLVKTFVEVGSLQPLLSSIDHQILYGRRGTGKTHALNYLAKNRFEQGDIPILIDLRNIGSNNGIYGDTTLPIHERGTRLLIDVLVSIHDSLLETVLSRDTELDLSLASPQLDKLAASSTQVKIHGTTEKQSVQTDSNQSTSSVDTNIQLGKEPIIGLKFNNTQGMNSSAQTQLKEAGSTQVRVSFGEVSDALRSIVRFLSKRRIWLLLDEWSSIPIDLQPYLADLLRRAVFPIRGITVKIAAIEQRSKFKLKPTQDDYIGIELGSDASADVNLDDFMVFDNDAQRATDFYRELIFRHYLAALENGYTPKSSSELIQMAFTQNNTFEEFVRSSEGVPRDAINILMLSAQYANNERGCPR